MSSSNILSDSEWGLISSYFECGNYGKNRMYSQREMVEAICYIAETGCQWRKLPDTFPPWTAVYSFFRRCQERGVWERVLQALVEKGRLILGRSASPTYGLIDSQSVPTTGPGEERGIDGGKKGERAQTSCCVGC